MTVQEHLTEKTFSHFSLGREDKKRNKIIIKAKMRDPSKKQQKKDIGFSCDDGVASLILLSVMTYGD